MSDVKQTEFAPVALFVYNRLEHTKITVECLLRNNFSELTDLYIYSDGPKSDNARKDVELVRNFIDKITGFKSIKIIKREFNYGLAKSIIKGVDELCEIYGRVIVLEDDLITSVFFLKYMNDALNYYKDDDFVFHVSGCRYPVEDFDGGDTFFLRVPLCWGWGTWSRSWRFFKKDINLVNKFNKKMIKNINFNNEYDYWNQILLNKRGVIDTWFIFWYVALYLNSAYAVFPSISLVNNIGFDGSGQNCQSSYRYQTEISNREIVVEGIAHEESTSAYKAHEKYFKLIHVGLIEKIIKKISTIL